MESPQGNPPTTRTILLTGEPRCPTELSNRSTGQFYSATRLRYWTPQQNKCPPTAQTVSLTGQPGTLTGQLDMDTYPLPRQGNPIGTFDPQQGNPIGTFDPQQGNLSSR
jgi:hypothetical protein